MRRFGIAFFLSLMMTAFIYVGLVVAILYAPRQLFVDYLLEPDSIGRDQKLIDFLIADLREMILELATAVAVVVALACWVWLFRSSRAEIAVPGDARRYSSSWLGIAVGAAVAAASAAAFLTFNGMYTEILRFEARWIMSAFALPAACVFVYWLITAVWTPSMQAPAVGLSGLFRWIRRPFSL